MRTPSLQRKLVQFILLISMGLAVLLMSVVAPSLDRVRVLGERLDETERILRLYHEKTLDIKKTQEPLDKISDETDAYARAVVSKGEELALITRLESLAKEHGITQQMNARFVSPAQNEEPYYEFSFANTGQFQNQMTYMRALEQLPEYLIIKSLEWQAGPQRNDEKGAAAPVTVTFHAIVYAAASQ